VRRRGAPAGRGWRRLGPAAAALALALAATGCGVPVDAKPRPIPDDRVPFGLLNPATSVPAPPPPAP
jgi:hypothetical protein